MMAELLPLDGKYYGTEICIWYANNPTSNTVINIWIPEGEPSERACANWDVTQEQWRENIMVDNGWGGDSPIKTLFPNDNHYESELSYQVALKIVGGINCE